LEEIRGITARADIQRAARGAFVVARVALIVGGVGVESSRAIG
jgi:hypothetical protein